MNIKEADILNTLAKTPYENQRILAELSGHSTGAVNQGLKSLVAEGLLTADFQLTERSKEEIKEHSPKNAIILAAGFGMRMVPINTETPKAFLKVKGEYLIERLICQLHAAGIREIYVVVGFMKERFEYLIDDLGVRLIVNPLYSVKNNLHSLALAADRISNSYIVPCDVWCENNPFSKNELYSWYMVKNLTDNKSTVKVTRKGELSVVSEYSGGNQMLGIAYLCGCEAAEVRERLGKMDNDSRCDNFFWEAALYGKEKLITAARTVKNNGVIEINTFEQLMELDSGSDQLKNDKLDIITKTLNADLTDITDIDVLKKGMTNRSFLFSCKSKKYIMRIPGEGTDILINRREEAEVCRIIKDLDICEDILYIDPENGCKITRFIEGAENCDPSDPAQTALCMKKLRGFHEMNLKVGHTFDIFSHIDFYESLWNSETSVYRDYAVVKERVFALKKFIDRYKCPYVLTHIDAVCDNFLFAPGGKIYLIDWEYSGMQDPHVDIAMFIVYAMLDRENAERIIGEYFPEGCTKENRIKIYCYIAACGLLWSNWCEYKRQLGVEFGEYSLAQYRFAKEYSKIAAEEIKKMESKKNV